MIKVVTLGCSKNRVDSEHLLKQLENGGLSIASEEDDIYSGAISTVILNTCGFIKDAKEESIDAIFQAVKAKQDKAISKVIVFGCLAQRYFNELKEEIPEVDAFYGAFDIDGVLSEFSIKRDPSKNQQRIITTPDHYAYLKISEGCDRGCSYCAIPGIRGSHISVPLEELVKEAEFLASSGVKELNVVAQDTTYYGLDLYGKRELSKLLNRLSEVKGIEWIRLLYSYPAGFPDDLLETIADNPKVCKYLDIPLQHSADKVLKAMRRSIDGKETRILIDKIRKRIPDIVLRTTMIVGHPGEGKREFEDLLGFIKEFRFERLGAFTYSEEEGTYGAINLKDTISKKLKQERLDILMEEQSKISLICNLNRIGNTETVLIDSVEEDRIIARSRSEAPEVDGEIILNPVEEICKYPKSDNFVKVKIIDADEYDLYARLL